MKCEENGRLLGDITGCQAETVRRILADVAVNELIKQASIKFGIKFGTKGIVNLGKMLPGVGAVIGGGLDLVETKVIADRAYKWFMKGDFTQSKEEEEAVVVDTTDFEEAVVNSVEEFV